MGNSKKMADDFYNTDHALQSDEGHLSNKQRQNYSLLSLGSSLYFTRFKSSFYSISIVLANWEDEAGGSLVHEDKTTLSNIVILSQKQSVYFITFLCGGIQKPFTFTEYEILGTCKH
jgi:hypothetical protein